MPASRSLLLALLLSLAGTACAANPPTLAGARDATPANTEEPAMTCQAAKGQWAVGQTADEAVMARILADTTSERARIIRPGMAVTMDFREERVNVDVDADNRILAVRCG